MSDFTSRTVIEYAIRLQQYGGKVAYVTKTHDGTRAPRPSVPLTKETAERQLGMYTASAEPTIVTREVTIIEGSWGEL